jgi:PGF-CTERM protein
MTKRLSLVLIACVALALFMLPASAADPRAISAGQDVFIGEIGLDISGAGVTANSTISWYTDTATPGSSAASATVTVVDPTSFYVAPADFVGRTGNWYLAATNTKAFQVRDPSIDVKIWDQNAEKDVTGLAVPAGDTVNFRIESNMYSMSQRSDFAASTPDMRIKVKTSDGTIYTSLVDPFGTAIPLTGLKVNKQAFYWQTNTGNSTTDPNFGWYTLATDSASNRLYKAGTYTIWVESNINKMKDNYKDPSGTDYTGRTVSATKTITIASDTVKIESNKDSVVRGNPFSVTVTGRPNTLYYLWVKGTSSMSGSATDQPPRIVSGQDSVTFDPAAGPWTIGAYHFQGAGVGQVINNPAAARSLSDVAAQPANGTVYYAQIKTSNSGTRTIGFATSQDTKDKKYTIHVERTDASGAFKSDEVDVTIQKGAVTVVAAGDQSYFLGEQIKLSGTNSETDTVYLFMTGPNLPSVGGALTAPRTAVVNGVSSTFTTADVLEDNTWEYKWQTANLNVDAGTYTVYAVSDASDKDHLTNSQYGTVSVIIRKPFVSATASQAVVAAGDKLFVTGTAEGKPSPGVALWILGKNFAAFATESVNADSTFSHEVTSATTKSLASGQYFLVVQHPMYNDRFDVFPNNPTAPTLVQGAYPVFGNTLFTLTGAGALQGSDAANALVDALNNAAVDDTYTKLQFLVENPTIHINPVTDKSVGAKFTIEGTTNLAVDDELLVEVVSSSFKPTDKTQSGEFSGATGTVKVVKGTGDGFNTWSFPVDSSAFKPDEYIVKASGITVDVSATTLFNVVAFTPTPTPTPTPVVTAPVNATKTVPPTTIPPTTAPTAAKSPGFGAMIALIGLGAVAFLVVRKH